MEYRRFDNIIIARIDKGEEILEPSMISQSEYTRQMRRNITQTVLRDIMKLHR